LRRIAVAFLLAGGAGMFALMPAMMGEGSPEAVNNKPAWLGWAVLGTFVFGGIGIFLLVRASRTPR
jgi:hypothetical protein